MVEVAGHEPACHPGSVDYLFTRRESGGDWRLIEGIIYRFSTVAPPISLVGSLCRACTPQDCPRIYMMR